MSDGEVTLWLEDERRVLTLAVPCMALHALLTTHGIPYRVRHRAWTEPTLADEPLLADVNGLGAPLEIVHNGTLAAVGVAHLRLRDGDELVIGRPDFLRRRFPFFR